MPRNHSTGGLEDAHNNDIYVGQAEETVSRWRDNLSANVIDVGHDSVPHEGERNSSSASASRFTATDWNLREVVRSVSSSMLAVDPRMKSVFAVVAAKRAVKAKKNRKVMEFIALGDLGRMLQVKKVVDHKQEEMRLYMLLAPFSQQRGPCWERGAIAMVTSAK